MKVVEINAVDTGSTGKIMLGIADVARESGIQIATYSGSRRKQNACPKNHCRISTWVDYYLHKFIGYCFGVDCHLSNLSTLKLINRIKKESPNIIHLHILHGSYINYTILFKFLKKYNVPVVWTFHDCWAFTGRCPYFTVAGCSKWISGCNHCKYPKKLYPSTLFDYSKREWKNKKKLFCALQVS